MKRRDVACQALQPQSPTSHLCHSLLLSCDLFLKSSHHPLVSLSTHDFVWLLTCFQVCSLGREGGREGGRRVREGGVGLLGCTGRAPFPHILRPFAVSLLTGGQQWSPLQPWKQTSVEGGGGGGRGGGGGEGGHLRPQLWPSLHTSSFTVSAIPFIRALILFCSRRARMPTLSLSSSSLPSYLLICPLINLLCSPTSQTGG